MAVPMPAHTFSNVIIISILIWDSAPFNDRINIWTVSSYDRPIIRPSFSYIEPTQQMAHLFQWNNFNSSTLFDSPRKKRYLQLCGQETGWIIFVLQNVVAFVDGVEQQKCIADGKQCGQAACDQFPGWWSRRSLNVCRQLFDQLLLTFFDVRLYTKANRFAWVSFFFANFARIRNDSPCVRQPKLCPRIEAIRTRKRVSCVPEFVWMLLRLVSNCATIPYSTLFCAVTQGNDVIRLTAVCNPIDKRKFFVSQKQNKTFWTKIFCSIFVYFCDFARKRETIIRSLNRKTLNQTPDVTSLHLTHKCWTLYSLTQFRRLTVVEVNEL